MKRPFAELEHDLQKTNPNGTQFQVPRRDSTNISDNTEEKTKNKFYRPPSPSSRPPEVDYKYINTQ